MFVSRSLRKSNIAEYLLYMWQVEDLLRANEFDMSRITANVIDSYQLDEAQRAELVEWYENLIEMMKHEEVTQRGHLQINRNVIIALDDLHDRLMQSSKFPYYHAAYYKVLPYIVQLRAKNHTTDEPELETCFDALYGVWMLRLQKKTVGEETAAAIADITTFVGLLNDYYMKDRNGELDLDAAPEVPPTSPEP